LKDRKVDSEQSVLLGTGVADFDACFRALKEIEYQGAYTLQAWRGDEFLVDARAQLAFVINKLNTAYGI
jgi:sugar phosphate isomerase/epimerase